MTFRSGNPAVDRYIAEDYETVRGMSSAFAATICGHLIRRQTALGISGHIAEIGTFEGRFFIAMALGLAEGERALGIDTFDWPNDGLLDLFHSHCARLGLAKDRYAAIKAKASELSPADVTKALGGPVRFWHLDGDHSREALTADLALAEATLHPQGMIVLDDMLHPGYPLLIVAVRAGPDGHLQGAALDPRLRMGALFLRRADPEPAYRGGGLRRGGSSLRGASTAKQSSSLKDWIASLRSQRRRKETSYCVAVSP